MLLNIQYVDYEQATQARGPGTQELRGPQSQSRTHDDVTNVTLIVKVWTKGLGQLFRKCPLCHNAPTLSIVSFCEVTTDVDMCEDTEQPFKTNWSYE